MSYIPNNGEFHDDGFHVVVPADFHLMPTERDMLSPWIEKEAMQGLKERLFDFYKQKGLVTKDLRRTHEGQPFFVFSVRVPAAHVFTATLETTRGADLPRRQRVTIEDLFKTIGEVVALPLKLIGWEHEEIRTSENDKERPRVGC